MPDLNRVQLMGRLTFAPELRRTADGTAVGDLRMAVNRSFQGRDGQRREEVLYIDVTVWGRQAENCERYLRKGSIVFVEGSLKTDQWEDKTTGEKRSKVRVQADRVQFLDGKPDDGGRRDDDPTPRGRRDGCDRRTRDEPVSEPDDDDTPF